MRVFADPDILFRDVIYRFLNFSCSDKVYVKCPEELDVSEIIGSIRYKRVLDLDDNDIGFMLLIYSEIADYEEEIDKIKTLSYTNTIIIGVKMPFKSNNPNDMITNMEGIYICNFKGFFFWVFSPSPSYLIDDIPPNFKVMAIMHCYNEVDIASAITEYLLSQELDIFFLDNWSDDGTFEILQGYQAKYGDRISLERFPKSGSTGQFELYRQLEKTEDISKKLLYDWFIHYDMDEIRVTPWVDVNLREMIYMADKQGANIIENTVINFELTDRNETNLFMKDGYFCFGTRPTHFQQQKTWKRTEDFDLKSSGGHTIRMSEPRIYPYKILNRHYPFRSIDQSKKKIFKDRKPRFGMEKAKLGWHGQYDKIIEESDLIKNKADLIKWETATRRDYFPNLFLGCGLVVDKPEKNHAVKIPSLVFGKKIAIYGAGSHGKDLYMNIRNNCDVVCWVDKDYKYIPRFMGERIKSPDALYKSHAEYVIVSIMNEKVRQQIRYDLINNNYAAERILLL